MQFTATQKSATAWAVIAAIANVEDAFGSMMASQDSGLYKGDGVT